MTRSHKAKGTSRSPFTAFRHVFIRPYPSGMCLDESKAVYGKILNDMLPSICEIGS